MYYIIISHIVAGLFEKVVDEVDCPAWSMVKEHGGVDMNGREIFSALPRSFDPSGLLPPTTPVSQKKGGIDKLKEKTIPNIYYNLSTHVTL